MRWRISRKRLDNKKKDCIQIYGLSSREASGLSSQAVRRVTLKEVQASVAHLGEAVHGTADMGGENHSQKCR